MAVTAGDVLRFHDGSEFTVVKSAADTGGEALELEMFFPPTTEDVPHHIHPEQAETYEVIEGAFKVLVGSEWLELEPGQSATVPAGTVHTFRIVGDQPARVRNLHMPALDFEDYFATESRLMREGKIKSYSRPVAILDDAGLLRQYRHCMVMASPALRAAIAALAPIGRVLLARSSR
jgi:mannose-6-phosphate isomerase-like protein (cupin superfamily)